MNGDKANHESTWADQWDYNNNKNSSYPDEAKGSSDGGTAAKCKQKVGEGLVKTKAVASTGAKKVKEGASAGFHWIKEKCQKATQKR